MRARVWVAQGRLDEAGAWAREQRLSAEDDLSYLREFEHVTLARVLLAQATDRARRQRREQAVALLERLLGAAEAGGRTGSVIEILVLLALAHEAWVNGAAAPARAGPGLDAGRTRGLRPGLRRPGASPWRRCCERPRGAGSPRLCPAAAGRRRRAAPAGTPSSRASLVDPLSDRELDVLRLLATDLGGPEIARELVVSLNTVRTHTKNIYAKLGVNNRRAAVRRADELHLLRLSPPAGRAPSGSADALTGRMAAAPRRAQTPATAYSTP